MYRYEAHAILKPGTPGTTAVLRQSVTVTIRSNQSQRRVCSRGVVGHFCASHASKAQIRTVAARHPTNGPPISEQTDYVLADPRDDAKATTVRISDTHERRFRPDRRPTRQPVVGQGPGVARACRPDSPCPGPMVLLSFVSLVLS